MNFSPRPEEPEINLIPFIDVLLVVLIFLMLSTTYSKFTELQLKLPVADADAQRDYPQGGDRQPSAATAATRSTSSRSPAAARMWWPALIDAAKAGKDTVVIISADATAPHQSVITVMEAARRAGLTQITFATQSSAQGGAR
jgi:biopolymer transport protein ExbD